MRCDFTKHRGTKTSNAENGIKGNASTGLTHYCHIPLNLLLSNHFPSPFTSPGARACPSDLRAKAEYNLDKSPVDDKADIRYRNKQAFTSQSQSTRQAEGEHEHSTQKGLSQNPDPEPSCHEATAVATAPLCHPSLLLAS